MRFSSFSLFYSAGKKSNGATMQAKELFHNVTNLSSPKRTSNSARQKVQQISQYATPKPNQASKYTDLWKPYVAANLHFYLVPFAIFIRRAREFDFTRGDFQRSMDHLTRVIRVFTPKLVSTLDLLLEDTEENSTLGNIIKRHEEALGLFCPPCFGEGRKQFNLKMLQEEMHNLLEEITIQHEKTVGEQYFIERMFSKIEGIFGSKAEEIVISKLVQKAKVIVKFPQDYEVVPSSTRKNVLFRKPSVFDKSSAINNDSPERESNGIISEKGREQLLHGSRLCNPIDVKFLGDPMYARPKSHEIDFLVKWALKLSNKLNVYFHLDVPQESKLYGINTNMTAEQLAMEERNMTKVGLFRFNLRFIADKRNWITIFFIWKIFRWIIIG
jgi:hypothetical protein